MSLYKTFARAAFCVIYILHCISAANILWEICEQSRCDNCTQIEGFRCWRAVKGEHYLKDVAVCLHFTIDPNERYSPEPACNQCQSLKFLSESNARIEQCMDKIITAHGIVLAEKTNNKCEMDWLQKNTVYIVGGLQILVLAVSICALVWAWKCQKKVAVTKFIYKSSPPLPTSGPPAVFDLNHYDEPTNY